MPCLLIQMALIQAHQGMEQTISGLRLLAVAVFLKTGGASKSICKRKSEKSFFGPLFFVFRESILLFNMGFYNAKKSGGYHGIGKTLGGL